MTYEEMLADAKSATTRMGQLYIWSEDGKETGVGTAGEARRLIEDGVVAAEMLSFRRAGR